MTKYLVAANQSFNTSGENATSAYFKASPMEKNYGSNGSEAYRSIMNVTASFADDDELKIAT